MNNIIIILNKPSHPGNIGAVARAIKNMGLKKLILVAPLDFPSNVATARAAHAKDILLNATVVTTLPEALANLQWTVAISGKQPSMAWPATSVRQCAQKINDSFSGKAIGLLFGCESNGLSRKELQLCQARAFIPANNEYSSLNLAQAVQIMTYEIYQAHNEQETRLFTTFKDNELATHKELEGFYNHLFTVLENIEFFNRRSPKKLIPRLRRLYGRLQMDKTELNILRGILSTIEKKLKNKTL